MACRPASSRSSFETPVELILLFLTVSYVYEDSLAAPQAARWQRRHRLGVFVG